MTIPSLMIYPSIWMQKTFFQYAEVERGARIGHVPAKHREEFTTSIRVAAVAHAIFQIVYADFILFSLIVASVLTAVVTPLSTGFFTQEGRLLERIAISFGAAIASLTIPIVLSLYTAVNPDELSNAHSISVQFPIYGHAALLACTLPTLSDLPEQLTSRVSVALSGQVPSGDSFFSELASAAIHWLAGSDLSREFLNQVEQRYYAWRTLLPVAIFNQMEGDLSNYDRAFDITSAEFSEAVLTSLRICAHTEA